jgi:hypothetical protein
VTFGHLRSQNPEGIWGLFLTPATRGTNLANLTGETIDFAGGVSVFSVALHLFIIWGLRGNTDRGVSLLILDGGVGFCEGWKGGWVGRCV